MRYNPGAGTLPASISTGALLATHAFLGTPDDDRILKRLYTEIDRRDIYRRSLWRALFGGPALNRTDPMAGLIAETITPEVLTRVAAEFDKNRRLFVAATNLDYKDVPISGKALAFDHAEMPGFDPSDIDHRLVFGLPLSRTRPRERESRGKGTEHRQCSLSFPRPFRATIWI